MLGGLEDAHHLNRLVRGDGELPLSGSFSELAAHHLAAAGVVLRLARFEFGGGDHAGSARRHRDPHRLLRPDSIVVCAAYHCFRHGIPRVDQPQAALLRHVLPGIEYGHVVAPRLDLRDDVVDAGDEPVAGPDEGEGQDVEVSLELEPPVALALSDSVREFPLFIQFEVLGIEVPARICPDGKLDLPGFVAGVVDGADIDRAGAIRTVDDPDESGERVIARRQDQRKGVLGSPAGLNKRSRAEHQQACQNRPSANACLSLHQSSSSRADCRCPLTPTECAYSRRCRAPSLVRAHGSAATSAVPAPTVGGCPREGTPPPSSSCRTRAPRYGSGLRSPPASGARSTPATGD